MWLLCLNGCAFKLHCQVLPKKRDQELLLNHTAIKGKECMANGFPTCGTSNRHSSQRNLSLSRQILKPQGLWGLHVQSSFQEEVKELSGSRWGPRLLPIHPYGNQEHKCKILHQQEGGLDAGNHLKLQNKNVRIIPWEHKNRVDRLENLRQKAKPMKTHIWNEIVNYQENSRHQRNFSSISMSWK